MDGGSSLVRVVLTGAAVRPTLGASETRADLPPTSASSGQTGTPHGAWGRPLGAGLTDTCTGPGAGLPALARSLGKHRLSRTTARRSAEGLQSCRHPGPQTALQTRDADTGHCPLLKRLHQKRWCSLSRDHRGPPGTEGLTPRASLYPKHRQLPHHWDPGSAQGRGGFRGSRPLWGQPRGRVPRGTPLPCPRVPVRAGQCRLRRKHQSRSDSGWPWHDPEQNWGSGAGPPRGGGLGGGSSEGQSGSLPRGGHPMARCGSPYRTELRTMGSRSWSLSCGGRDSSLTLEAHGGSPAGE